MLESETVLMTALKPSLVANLTTSGTASIFDKTTAKPCQEKNPHYSFNFAEQLQKFLISCHF